MQNPWWLAILVGLLSGGLSVLVTYSFNYKKERAQFLRERAEKLFVSLDGFQRWVLSDITVLIATKRDPNLDYGKEQTQKAISDYESVSTIAEIYFPHIVKYIDNVESSRDGLAASRENYLRNRDEKSLRVSAKNFSDAIVVAKRQAAAQCRNPLRKINYVRLVKGFWN